MSNRLDIRSESIVRMLRCRGLSSNALVEVGMLFVPWPCSSGLSPLPKLKTHRTANTIDIMVKTSANVAKSNISSFINVLASSPSPVSTMSRVTRYTIAAIWNILTGVSSSYIIFRGVHTITTTMPGMYSFLMHVAARIAWMIETGIIVIVSPNSGSR